MEWFSKKWLVLDGFRLRIDMFFRLSSQNLKQKRYQGKPYPQENYKNESLCISAKESNAKTFPQISVFSDYWSLFCKFHQWRGENKLCFQRKKNKQRSVSWLIELHRETIERTRLRITDALDQTWRDRDGTTQNTESIRSASELSLLIKVFFCIY